MAAAVPLAGEPERPALMYAQPLVMETRCVPRATYLAR